MGNDEVSRGDDDLWDAVVEDRVQCRACGAACDVTEAESVELRSGATIPLCHDCFDAIRGATPKPAKEVPW